MPNHHPPRLDPSLYLGVQQYFLTICCQDRRSHLLDPKTCGLAIAQLQRTGTAEDIVVIAYCLMPDHVHLVVEGLTDAADCLEFIRLFKQRTAYWWKKAHKGRLWQDSFYDHVLRASESTQQKVRYMLENPVRAGIVTHPWDYEYSGSCVYTREALFDWAFGVSRRGLL